MGVLLRYIFTLQLLELAVHIHINLSYQVVLTQQHRHTKRRSRTCMREESMLLRSSSWPSVLLPITSRTHVLCNLVPVKHV